MEQKTPRPMSLFDSLTALPCLDILKCMLPYTPPSMQHILAVYIKFTEFQYTIYHFFGFPNELKPPNIFDTIKGYMEPDIKEQMEQIQNIMNMMDMMSGTMSPEQQDIFEQYSHIFEEELSQAETCDTKGVRAHERMDESPGNEEYRSGKAGTDTGRCQTDHRQKWENSGPDHDGSDYQCQ